MLTNPEFSPPLAFIQALLPDVHLNSLHIKDKETLAFHVLLATVTAARNSGLTFDDVAVGKPDSEIPHVLGFMRGALIALLLFKPPGDGGRGKDQIPDPPADPAKLKISVGGGQ